MKPYHTAAILACLGLYWAMFFVVRLPSLETQPDAVWLRASFFLFLFEPGILLDSWFGTPLELSLADRLPVLLIAAMVVATSLGLGRLLLAVCRIDPYLTRLEQFVFSTAVGLNVLSTWTLAVGLAGWLNRWTLLLVPAVVAIAGTAVPWKHRSKPVPAVDSADHLNLPSRRWLWAAVPFLAVIVLGGMLPPTDFDVREYHLQAPKEFFQQGRVTFLPHNVYANMALGTEMLSLMTMTIAGDWWLGALAGKMVIALFAPLTALGLLAAGRRFHGTAAGVVAAIVYLSIPWIVRVSTGGLVEGAVACYLLLAVYAVLLWRQQKGPSMSLLALAGYLAGGAVACKYPAVLFVVIPLATWILMRKRCQEPFPRSARPLCVFLLAAGLGCGLWFAKNAVQTGNPTYPLLYGLFDGRSWTPDKNDQWNRAHSPGGFGPGVLAGDLRRVVLASEWLSPLVVSLAALAFLPGRSRRLPLALAAYFGFTIAAWWLLTHRIDRFWIPVLPLLALLAGMGACWNSARWWRHTLVGLLVVGLTWSFLVVTTGPGGYNRYFVALERLRTDPQRVSAWHADLNARIEPPGRVLVVGDAQVFDLEMPILYNTCFDDSIFEQIARDRTPEQIAREFSARGITHVYVNWREVLRYRSPGNYGFTEFVQRDVFQRLVEQGVLEPVRDGPWKAEGDELYRVVGP